MYLFAYFFFRFDIAHTKSKVIVVVKGDVPSKEETPPSLYSYIQTNTYLESSDPIFLKKLRSVLPHKGSKPTKIAKNIEAPLLGSNCCIGATTSNSPKMEINLASLPET